MQSVTSNAVAEELKSVRFTAVLVGANSYIDITPTNNIENYLINYGYLSSGMANTALIWYYKSSTNTYMGIKSLTDTHSWVTIPTVSNSNGKIRVTHVYGDGTRSLISKI